jgi:cobalt-zinc-cadmium efflux system protein
MPQHRHHPPIAVDQKLKIGILLSLLILVAEVAGGILSNSLALLADAGHVLTDVIALGLSWYGVRQSRRPSSYSMTFGYHRIGVLVAVVNALSILVIAAFILYEAVQRFSQPPEVDSGLMLSIALLGLGVNILVALWLRQESHGNLNVKSAFWHAAGDALASVGVITGGIVIALSGWNIVDPIVSIIISLIIVTAAWGIFKEGLRVLLEGTPRHIDLGHLAKTLHKLPGVKDVHDLHIWSITPEIHALSCHVLIEDQSVSQSDMVRQDIEATLKQEFDIDHCTLQMECQQCGANELLCQMQLSKADTRHDEENQRRHPNSRG